MKLKKIGVWVIKKAAITPIRLGLLLFGKERGSRLRLEIAEGLAPSKVISIDGKETRFLCPSYDTLFRYEKFFDKEPETLAWIDSFADGEVLWDIGANIGVYSIYAALKRNVKVLAFEPSAANYWVLNKNIELNGFDKQVTAYCLALSQNTFLGSFNMADTDIGGACYHFGKEVQDFEYPGLGTRRVMFHQGMLGISIDELLATYRPAFPNHIKIDVDGIEKEIILGAAKTLSDKRLKSISVELDETQTGDVHTVTAALQNSGFRLKSKLHAQEFDHGASKHIFNFLFLRNEN